VEAIVEAGARVLTTPAVNNKTSIEERLKPMTREALINAATAIPFSRDSVPNPFGFEARATGLWGSRLSSPLPAGKARIYKRDTP